ACAQGVRRAIALLGIAISGSPLEMVHWTISFVRGEPLLTVQKIGRLHHAVPNLTSIRRALREPATKIAGCGQRRVHCMKFSGAPAFAPRYIPSSNLAAAAAHQIKGPIMKSLAKTLFKGSLAAALRC